MEYLISSFEIRIVPDDIPKIVTLRQARNAENVASLSRSNLCRKLYLPLY